MDFFNRYNEEQNVAQQQHEDFKSNTNKYFLMNSKVLISILEKKNLDTELKVQVMLLLNNLILPIQLRSS